MKKMRFQIVFTYDCNLACKYCDRFLDVLPWKDTEMTMAELELGYRMMVKAGVQCSMSRIGGGEPLTHPDFVELTANVIEWWSNMGCVTTTVATNGVLVRTKGMGVKYRCSPPNDKRHRPVMISLADLGIDPEHGIVDECKVAKVCGRGFDCHGFTSCPYAGPIGRILGIDPYHPMPVSLGQPEICCHCIHSLSKRKREEIWDAADAGEIKFPTKTFQKGLNRHWYGQNRNWFIRLEERVRRAGLE